MEITLIRIGEAILMLGLLVLGFGLSSAKTDADTRTLALFAVGVVVMILGIGIILFDGARALRESTTEG